jgi:hypothetical protein
MCVPLLAAGVERNVWMCVRAWSARDAGAANFLRDRLFFSSDKYRVHVCDICGLIAVANLKKRVFSCKNCKNSSEISQVRFSGCSLSRAAATRLS